MSNCLADHGRHRWQYRQDSMLGKLRECQKCGVLEQQQIKKRLLRSAVDTTTKRYVQIGAFHHGPS